jgi:hypothetical protein
MVTKGDVCFVSGRRGDVMAVAMELILSQSTHHGIVKRFDDSFCVDSLPRNFAFFVWYNGITDVTSQ